MQNGIKNFKKWGKKRKKLKFFKKNL